MAINEKGELIEIKSKWPITGLYYVEHWKMLGLVLNPVKK